MSKHIIINNSAQPALNAPAKYNGVSYRKVFCRVAFFFAFWVWCISATAQVTASFTIDDSTGCSPKLARFTSTSTGATTYSWDIGNGFTSTGSTATGFYTAPGIYTVTLTASNGTSSATHSRVVSVYPAPTVSFYGSDTSVCPAAPITFTSTSIPGAPGSLTYNWNFGDGNSSTSTSPVYNYYVPGRYNVTLFATNTAGCIGSSSLTRYIHVNSAALPGYTATGSYCHAPATVPFTNSTTGTASLSYRWMFGDGATSTATNPVHLYTASGSYDVLLQVTDGHGCIDTLLQRGYINVDSIAARFTPSTSGCRFAPVQFNNSSSPHTSCMWYFGDGGSSSSDTSFHTYSASGTYSVKLVIYNGTCSDSVTHPIIITAPSGTIIITPTQSCQPTIVRTYSASVPTGSSMDWYSLLFGSLGSATYGHSVTNVIPPQPTMSGNAGTIDSITMVITSVNGCKDTIGKLDTVNGLNLHIGSSPENGCLPLRAAFNASLISLTNDVFAGNPYYNFGFPGPDGNIISFNYPYSVSTYSWNFGDGSPASAAPAPVHMYTARGAYTVSCSVVTSNGCFASATTVVEAGNPPPAPTGTVTPSRACAGTKVSFTATGSGTFTNFFWDYGDGGQDTSIGDSKKTHAYSAPGIYNANVTSMDHGCPSISYYVPVTVDSPGASIKVIYSCIPGNQVTVIDSSVGDDTHLWSFGDGFTSTAANPVHNYPALNSYNIVLSTFNVRSGCRDTARYLVQLAKMRFHLSESHSNVCRDAPDSFRVKVDNAPPGDSIWVTKYKWYFDGTLTDTLVTQDTVARDWHTYHGTGGHITRLVMQDNHGCFDTGSLNVQMAKPVAGFSFSPPLGCASGGVIFSDLSTDVVPLASYAWSFGDGSTSTSGLGTITHIYPVAGTYTVTEIVSDNIGCRDTFTSASHPVVHKPAAGFTASLTNACVGFNVNFANTSVSALHSSWNFGDGDTSILSSPDHVYRSAGIFSVRLVIFDSYGCSDTLIRSNYITVNPTPHASFYMTDSFSVCPPLNVNCVNTSTGASSYFWTFGDGTASVFTSPNDIYITPGSYTIKLTATNSFGCPDTAIGHASIFGYTGAFSYTPLTGCTPMAVHFRAILSGVTSIVWDFNDGTISSASLSDTISHSYVTPGYYIPKLILTDSNNCTSFSTGSDTIKADNVTSSFTFSPSSVCQNGSVTFHETSSGYFSGITSRLWTFAPGVTNSSPSPSYSFTASGTYPVSLKVTDAIGCSKTTSGTVTVSPLPAPITGVFSVCVGSSATLSSTTGSGNWTSSNALVATIGSTSGTVTGLTTGFANITYTLPTGCKTVSTVTVFSVTPITGTPVICIGQTSVMTNTTPGGTWSSSNALVANVIAGSVRGISAGTAIITYGLSAGCAAMRTVTVNPSPSLITGPTGICAGVTVLLSDADAGGKWSSNNTAIATIDSATGLLTGLSSGLATIFYTLGTSCFTTATETVNTPPAAITGAGQVCERGTILLANLVGGGNWSSSNNVVATVGSGTGRVTGVTAGTVVITYNLGSGCAATKTITVNPLPGAITGATGICTGLTAVLADPISGGYWSSSNTFTITVGSASGIITGISAGSATITYTLSTGCAVTTSVTDAPVPSPAAGSGDVCLGSTIVLTDPTSGGAWTSSNTSVATIASGTGLVTGVSAGTATISYALGTGCSVLKTVTVNATPTVFTVTGGGRYCAGDAGMSIGLSGSETGISYQLYRGAVPFGATVTGTGSAISFGLLTAAGTYTVSARNAATSCASNMAGGAAIVVDPLPLALAVIGGGNYCAGDTGVVIGLASSQAGITYQLYMGPGAVGASVTGTGGVIHFGTFTTAGTYTVTATDPATGCQNAMSGSAVININPLPAIQTITGGGSYCSGSGGLTIGLSGSQAGVNYQLYNGASPAGLPVTGTGTAISFGFITAVGTYTVSATNSATSCTAGMAGSVVISINPLPATQTVTGGGSFCDGSTGASIGLSGSETGVSYQLYNGTTAYGTPVAGTGAALSFGIFTTAGVYTVSATDNTTSCSAGMAGSAIVVANALPVAQNVTGGGSYCLGTGGVAIGLSGSETGVNYQLYKGATATGGPVAGSGSAISFGMITAAGVYTVTATNATSLCANSMMGSAIVSIDSLPDAGVITGDSVVCQGTLTTLTDAVPGGVWSATNANASIVAGLVTGLHTGSDTVHYSLTNICGTSFAEKQILILEANNIHITTAPDNTLCADNLFRNFGADKAELPGTFFTWSAENATIQELSANKQYCLISFFNPGLSRIILSVNTLSSSCITADTFVAQVGTYVSSHPDVIYSYPMMICLDNAVDKYQWGYDDRFTLDSTVLPGEANQNYYVPNPDLDNRLYWVITDHRGCSQKAYYNAPTKIAGPSDPAFSISVFPNPADERLNIIVNEKVWTDDIDVNLYDNFGKKRMNQTIFDHKSEFNISALPPGVYFLMFGINGTKVASATFIKR